MKLLGLLSTALLACTALAAKKPNASAYDTYRSKAISSNPLNIDDKIYEELTTGPRDYSVAVLLTALEAKFGCQLCKNFQPEWDVIARSWQKGDKKGESRLLYTTLDFSNGRATFMKVLDRVLALFASALTDNPSSINSKQLLFSSCSVLRWAPTPKQTRPRCASTSRAMSPLNRSTDGSVDICHRDPDQH